MKIYSAQLKYTRRQLIAPHSVINFPFLFSSLVFPSKSIKYIIANIKLKHKESDKVQSLIEHDQNNYHWENSCFYLKSMAWKRRGRFSEFVGKRVQTFKTKGNLQWECLWSSARDTTLSTCFLFPQYVNRQNVCFDHQMLLNAQHDCNFFENDDRKYVTKVYENFFQEEKIMRSMESNNN